MKFFLNDIERVLREYGIPFRVHGNNRNFSFFGSIRRIEPTGCYYLEDALGAEPTFFDCILLVRKYSPQLARDNTLILVASPQKAFYRIAASLIPVPKAEGIHPTAIVDPRAEIGSRVYIGPYAVVGNCRIGEDSHIDSHVVIYDNSVIGARVRIEAHSAIGATGVVWAWGDDGERIGLPQTGGVLIGDDCFIGTSVTIVRGSLNESTTIGPRSLIAHGSKIGHGVILGPRAHLANNVSIAGSARIGENSFLGSASVITPNICIGADIVVGAGAVVARNYEQRGSVLAGVPAVPKPSKQRLRGVPERKHPYQEEHQTQ